MPPRHPGFLGLVLLLQAAAVFGQAPASVMFRGDPRHTGIYGTPAVRHFGGVQWRTATGRPIGSTPALAGGTLYFGSGDGSLYAVDATTGTERWRFQTGGAVSSPPAVAGETVYFTSRDHHLYALDAARGTVRWTFDLGADLPYAWAFDYFTSSPTVVAGTVYVRSFFEGEGYEVLGDTALARFMRERFDDGVPSVVVFASNYVPATVLTDTSEAALLRRYLERGRVVWIGPTPLAFLFDAEGAVRGLDFDVPERVLGIHYGGPDTRGYRGLYRVIPTEEGRRRGLAGWWTGCCSVAPGQVTTVLAEDEVGRAGGWEKTFGGPPGTGLLQLWVDRDLPEGLPAILQVAEFGLARP